MQKTSRMLIVILFGVLCIGISSMAEEITLTTYYPAPYGAYDELATAGDTNLATDSGDVGIGTETPVTRLHVVEASGAAPPSLSRTVAIFQRDSAAGSDASIEIIAGNAGNSVLDFGDGGDPDIGRIDYDHADNTMDFVTNNTAWVTINAAGNVGIGGAPTAYKLDVYGDINTSGEVRRVGMPYDSPDYVFEPGYGLMSLGQLKNYVLENRHLPNMPSAEDIKKEGVRIFEQNRVMLEKLEEAYLYIFELEERIQNLEKLQR